jgi:hypothetical protein
MDKRPFWPIPVGLAAWAGVGTLAYYDIWWPLYVVAAVTVLPGLVLLGMVLFTRRAKADAQALMQQHAQAPAPPTGPVAEPPVVRSSGARTNAKNAGRKRGGSPRAGTIALLLLSLWPTQGCNKIEEARERRRAREAGLAEGTGGAAPASADPTSATQPADASAPLVVAAQGDALAAVIARAIQRPNPSEATYRVDPFVAAMLVEHVRSGDAPRFTQLTAAIPDGPTAGYRIDTVAPGSVFAALGLRTGDVVTRINRVALTDVGRAAFALDGAANGVDVEIFRDDLTIAYRYMFVPGLAWSEIIAGIDVDAAGAPTLDPTPTVVTAAPVTDDVQPGAGSTPSTAGSAPSTAGSTPSTAGSTPSAGGSRPSGGTTPAGGGRPSGGGTSPGGSGSKPSSGGGTPTAPAGGSTNVSCESSSRCTVRKAYFDKMVASPSALEAQATIVPAVQNDVFSGYKLKTVKSGSTIAQLGFRSGDKITHINGHDLTDDLEAAQVYLGLGGTKLFKIRYERGGTSLVKTVVVE